MFSGPPPYCLPKAPEGRFARVPESFNSFGCGLGVLCVGPRAGRGPGLGPVPGNGAMGDGCVAWGCGDERGTCASSGGGAAGLRWRRRAGVPAGWEDGRSPGDPFVAVSAGRSPFRTSDLLELAELFGELDPNDRHAHHAGHLHLTILKYLFGREARLLIRAPRSNCKTTLPLTTYRSAHTYKTTQRPLFGRRCSAVLVDVGSSLRRSWPGRVSRPGPGRVSVHDGRGGEQPGDGQAVGDAPGEHFAHGLRQRHPARPEFDFLIWPAVRLLLGVQLPSPGGGTAGSAAPADGHRSPRSPPQLLRWDEACRQRQFLGVGRQAHPHSFRDRRNSDGPARMVTSSDAPLAGHDAASSAGRSGSAPVVAHGCQPMAVMR